MGEIGRHDFSLLARVDPSLNDPENFSISLICREKETDEKTEVVRIDNAEEKGPHIHRLYRRDEPEEQLDVDAWGAMQYIEERWKRYAKSYL